jgi:N-acetyl-gamma-glutamyl-phosphate reductase
MRTKVGIIGAAGYTGGELLRLLLQHPEIEITSAISSSQSGKKVYEVFPDLIGETKLLFEKELKGNEEIVFLCLPHRESKNYLEKHPEILSKRIIDLSRDHRLNRDAGDFVYGLPELNSPSIKKANHIANPGCFATAIQLALLPLASENKLHSSLYVSAITGSTGAGQSPTDTTHFSWRQNNVSAYQIFDHAHVPEIDQSLKQLQSNYSGNLVFVPQRGPYARGILSTCMLQTDLNENKLKEVYAEFYKNSSFTFVMDRAIDLKMVVNTNNCFIHLSKKDDKLVIISIIDNLLKGASGQAVQNMNLMLGVPEKTGLQLKCLTF